MHEFNVKSRPIFNIHGKLIEGHRENYREDTGESLAIVSDRYKIVHNKEVIDRVESCLKLGEFKKQIYCPGNGSRMYAVYDFKEQRAEVTKGDIIGMRITVRNSYDGSSGIPLESGGLRLVCLNGMTSTVNKCRTSGRHTTNLDLQYITDSINAAKAQFAQSIDNYQVMHGWKITQTDGSNLIKSLVKSKTLGVKRGLAIEDIWKNPTYQKDKDRNVYNLYNAITQNLTPEMDKSFELVSRTSRNVLKFLQNHVVEDSGNLVKFK